MNYNKNMDLEHNPILDSSLILATFLDKNIKLCNVKLIDCGDYVQVYLYKNPKKISMLDSDNLAELKTDDTTKEKRIRPIKLKPEISSKNIMRSKLECQRLAKSNIQDWKTFITLTFAENQTDIDIANKRFKYFVDKVKRVKNDFKYICIPEFQKRGAAHYHLLTNIDINDEKLVFSQENNKKFKHIKYWNDGFNKVDVLKGDVKKIIGYISKYMTKDIDDRLFNRHRYLFSKSLSKPVVNYLDLKDDIDNNFYIKKIQDKELVYQKEYVNLYDNNPVIFLELLKK